jgi:tetratricopeptide (TPR) repeat protein
LSQGAEADGLSTLASLASSYGTTPAARDGVALTAHTHYAAGRFAEAIASWQDYGRRGGSADQASEGLIRSADLAMRQKTAAADGLARQALGELLTRYPSSVRALRSLQMKMALEDRGKLRQSDPQFTGEVPTSLVTLRDVARDAGTAPVAEFALWRLGQELRDRRVYQLAVDAYAELGTRFPATRYDTWFSAAEIYERQLKDPAKAREAYGKVPSTSPRYEQAQQRARAES